MPTLTQGQSAAIQLVEGGYVTVTPSGQAQVATRGASGAPLQAPATISTATTYGPYSESGVVVVSALYGSCDYAETSLVSGAWVDPVYAWVNRGTPAANAGKVYRISDIGKPGAGSWWTSDGVRDLPMNGSAKVLSSCIPIIMPPNGTMGANGALSGLATALDTIYNAAAGGCYMYFAAGQVYSGSVAGFYYVQMSTTQAGTVFDNRLSGGWPEAPTTPTPIVAAGPGAYTGDSGADRTALSVTLPGGSMRRLKSHFAVQGNAGAAGTRFTKVFYGSLGYHYSNLGTANSFASNWGELVCLGSQARQRSTSYSDGSGYAVGSGVTGYTPPSASIDATVDQTLSITLRNSSGTDWLMMTAADVLVEA